MVSPDTFPVKESKVTPFTVQLTFPKIYARSKVPLFKTSESPVMFCAVPQVMSDAWEDARHARLMIAVTGSRHLDSRHFFIVGFMVGFMVWILFWGCLLP